MQGLLEANSERYVARMRALSQPLRQSCRVSNRRSHALLAVAVGRVAVDVALAPRSTQQASGLQFMTAVDPASEAAFKLGRGPHCLPMVLVQCNVAVAVSSVDVRLRRFRHPLARLGSLRVEGTAVIAQQPVLCPHTTGASASLLLNGRRLIRHVTVLGSRTQVVLPTSPPKVRRCCFRRARVLVLASSLCALGWTDVHGHEGLSGGRSRDLLNGHERGFEGRAAGHAALHAATPRPQHTAAGVLGRAATRGPRQSPGRTSATASRVVADGQARGKCMLTTLSGHFTHR